MPDLTLYREDVELLHTLVTNELASKLHNYDTDTMWALSALRDKLTDRLFQRLHPTDTADFHRLTEEDNLIWYRLRSGISDQSAAPTDPEGMTDEDAALIGRLRCWKAAHNYAYWNTLNL